MELALEKILNKLCCNGCIFFIDENCSHKDSENNNIEKSVVVKYCITTGGDFFNDFAKNINNHFICESFESK